MATIEKRLQDIKDAGTYRVLPINEGPCDAVITLNGKKVINLSSNIAALVTFIIAGNVYYPLGLAAAACSVAGNYLGSGLVVHDGQKIVRPVVLVVLGILFIKILTGN